MANIGSGAYDNVGKCNYEVPDYWDIGEVYEQLIEDVTPSEVQSDILETLFSVYDSWISEAISNYNTDFSISPGIIYESVTLQGRYCNCRNSCSFFRRIWSFKKEVLQIGNPSIRLLLFKVHLYAVLGCEVHFSHSKADF